jgi:hypothetical protein
MDDELRMQFSVPVLRQTQILLAFGNRSTALASAPGQRTAALLWPLQGHPKLVIHFCPRQSV